MITGIGQKEDTPYHEFGRQLAERGYVVFAPLILHYHPVEWTNDQVRQADAVGMMRVSMVIAQTQRVVDFLQTLPFVDPKRIGYYGLSYGGYSALWVPPLVDRAGGRGRLRPFQRLAIQDHLRRNAHQLPAATRTRISITGTCCTASRTWS